MEQNDTLTVADLKYYSAFVSLASLAASTNISKYFEYNKTVENILSHIGNMFDYRFHRVRQNKTKTWNKDVLEYEVFDGDNVKRGTLYFDIVSRDDKDGKSGAYIVSEYSSEGNTTAEVVIGDNLTHTTTNKEETETWELLSYSSVMQLMRHIGNALQPFMHDAELNATKEHQTSEYQDILPELFELISTDFAAMKLISEHVESGNKIPQDFFYAGVANSIRTFEKYDNTLNALLLTYIANSEAVLNITKIAQEKYDMYLPGVVVDNHNLYPYRH